MRSDFGTAVFCFCAVVASLFQNNETLVPIFLVAPTKKTLYKRYKKVGTRKLLKSVYAPARLTFSDLLCDRGRFPIGL